MVNSPANIKLESEKDFRVLFNEYYTPLVNYANSFLNDIGGAEDAVQEVFIAVWNKSDEGLVANKAKAYLYTSVRNFCLNSIRNAKRKEGVIPEYKLEQLEESSIEDEIIREEVYFKLHEAINSLPSQCQKIYKMSLAGQKNAEIAEDLNLSIETIKTQKKRAKKQLKEKLGHFTYLMFVFSINF